MMKKMFDAGFIRWINFFLISFGIVYSHIVVRKFKNFYIGVPLIIWLFQAFLYYTVYFSNYFGIITIVPEVSNNLFVCWATASLTLGLLTILTYLYYIHKSAWRGNGIS